MLESTLEREMPSQSTLSTDDKAKVKSALPGYKVFHAALARVYYRYPKPDKWSYAGLQGAIAFVRDTTKNTLSFRMVDLEGTRGVIWEHELYEGFKYHPDWACFHSFAGDECMIGFVFVDELEAKAFWKKVNVKKDQKASKTQAEKKKRGVGKGGIDGSMISGPTAGSFVHLGHMGYDDEQGFTSTGVDPSWTALLGTLEGSGITKEVLAKDMEFIKDFVRQYPQDAPKDVKKPKKLPPPPSRGTHSVTTSGSSFPSAQPPPPPAQISQPPPPQRPSQPSPQSFVHLGHIGYDAEQGFTATGVDPSWTALLGTLEGSGITKEVLAKDMEFIKDFVRQYPQDERGEETKASSTFLKAYARSERICTV